MRAALILGAWALVAAALSLTTNRSFGMAWWGGFFIGIPFGIIGGWHAGRRS